MGIAAVQTALKAIIASAAGVSDVEWSGTARAARFGKGPQIDLIDRNSAGLGMDETRRALDEDTDKIVETQVGQRTLLVGVRIESDSAALDVSARAVAERLRTALKLRRHLNSLRDAGISIVEILPTANGEYRGKDNRIASVAVLDVLFGWVDTASDALAAGDRIKTAEIEPQFTHADGSPGPLQTPIEGP